MDIVPVRPKLAPITSRFMPAPSIVWHLSGLPPQCSLRRREDGSRKPPRYVDFRESPFPRTWVNKGKKAGRYVPARDQKLLVAGRRPQDLDVVLGGDRHQSLHVGWLLRRYAQRLGGFAHFRGES